MKLQQAYFSEADSVGGWTLIGYTAPGKDNETNNFIYGGTGWTDKEAKSGESQTDAWDASSKAKLNDCPQGKNWQVDVTIAQGKDGYKSQVLNGADCIALTPTFGNIGIGAAENDNP